MSRGVKLGFRIYEYTDITGRKDYVMASNRAKARRQIKRCIREIHITSMRDVTETYYGQTTK